MNPAFRRFCLKYRSFLICATAVVLATSIAGVALAFFGLHRHD